MKRRVWFPTIHGVLQWIRTIGTGSNTGTFIKSLQNFSQTINKIIVICCVV